MQDTLLLTGGSGFVGRQIIPMLKEAGYQIKALARSEASAEKVWSYGAEPVLGDVTSPATLAKALEGCQFVVHAAAKMDFWGSKESFMNINVAGPQNLLQAAEQRGVKKFVYTGAASVVNGQPLYDVDETYIPAKSPQDYYSLSK